MTDISAIKPVVSNVLQAMDVVGVKIAGQLGGFDGLGFKFLGIIFGLMFFYYIIIFMIEGSNKIMLDITKLMITFSILSAMLMGWTNPMGGDSPTSKISVAGFFLKAIPEIADEFTGGVDPTELIVEKHADAIFNMFKVISPPENNTQTISDKLINSIPIFGFSTALHLITGEPSSGNAFQNASIFSMVISAVLLIIAAIVIILSLITFVFVLNAGQLMMYVGLGLGPILIPFLLIPKLSFLFDGWLKFMISASLYKVVAVIVGLLSLGVIDVVVEYSKNVSTGEENIIFLSLMVLFFALLGKQMMGMADNIATSIATGGANSGSGNNHSLIFAAAKTRLGSNNPKEPKLPKDTK